MRLALPASEDALDRRLLIAAEQACQALEARSGVRLEITRTRDVQPRESEIVCRLDSGAAVSKRADTAGDAYRLRIGSAGIEIAAPGPDGIRHGLQSLVQLASKRGDVPCALILDQPDFRDRGLMLDVSRGKVPTRRTLEEIVALCSRLRLNVLMLYVEHTFDFQRHPEIGADASPLTAETILALDAFAADRGVELVPCLQSLGHMERILSLDRYAKLAENERRWSLSPDAPGTYPLLEDLYDEFLPLFRSRRLNANCDEPFDLGQGRSSARAEREGVGRIFADHVERLRRLAGDRGKQLMIWADFVLKHPQHVDAFDRDVVLLDWWYEADFDADRIRKLRRKGFEVWGCPGTSSWNCLFPRVENAERNVARWAAAGRAHGAKGLLNTDWGDFGHYNALGVSLQSYAWGAQQAWSGEPERRTFDTAFDREIFGSSRPRWARVYRELGAIHDAGFQIFNGSAFQYLYFDPLARSYFLSHASRPVLERSAQRLSAILDEIDALSVDDSPEDFAGLARREIRWAARATLLAAQKGIAALEFNAWRAQSGGLRAAERRRLSRRLDALANEQAEQLSELAHLWMARNATSDFALTRRRLRKSITSLRRGARQLRDDTPPRPPRASSLDMTSVYNEVRGAKLR